MSSSSVSWIPMKTRLKKHCPPSHLRWWPSRVSNPRHAGLWGNSQGSISLLWELCTLENSCKATENLVKICHPSDTGKSRTHRGRWVWRPMSRETPCPQCHTSLINNGPSPKLPRLSCQRLVKTLPMHLLMIPALSSNPAFSYPTDLISVWKNISVSVLFWFQWLLQHSLWVSDGFL